MLAATLLAGSLQALAVAQDAPEFSATIDALVTGSGAGGGSRQQPVRILVQGDASRIDFSGPRNDQAYVLALAGGTRRWLVDRASGAALPIAGPAMPMRLDPADPCAAIRAQCARASGELIAGTIAQGWRYRDAGGRGPDGTSSGVLWVDPDNGLLLGYRGTLAGRPGERAMRAVSVALGPLDVGTLELPRSPQASEPVGSRLSP